MVTGAQRSIKRLNGSPLICCIIFTRYSGKLKNSEKSKSSGNSNVSAANTKFPFYKSGSSPLFVLSHTSCHKLIIKDIHKCIFYYVFVSLFTNCPIKKRPTAYFCCKSSKYILNCNSCSSLNGEFRRVFLTLYSCASTLIFPFV